MLRGGTLMWWAEQTRESEANMTKMTRQTKQIYANHQRKRTDCYSAKRKHRWHINVYDIFSRCYFVVYWNCLPQFRFSFSFRSTSQIDGFWWLERRLIARLCSLIFCFISSSPCVTLCGCLLMCDWVAHARAQDGWTVLMYAARYRRRDCVRLLVDAGANKDATDSVRNRSAASADTSDWFF